MRVYSFLMSDGEINPETGEGDYTWVRTTGLVYGSGAAIAFASDLNRIFVGGSCDFTGYYGFFQMSFSPCIYNI